MSQPLPNTGLTTVGNWPLNGSLADVSGNGLTMAVSFGSEIYETIGTFTGFRMDDGGPVFAGQNALLAPASALLRIGGELTIQMLWAPRKSTANTVFACDVGTDPDPRNNHALYECFIGAGGEFDWRDQTLAGIDPSNNFLPLVLIATYTAGVSYPTSMGTPRLWTWRRRHTTGATYVVEMFVNGTQIASVTTAAGTPFNTERFRVGNVSNATSADLSGVVGSVRVLTEARTTPDIVADYQYSVLGIPYPSQNTAIVYDAVAAAQFANAIHATPRAPS